MTQLLNVFVQNIFPSQANPILDPMQSPTSMVYSMSQRELLRRAPNRVHGPLPEQSSFVVAAGAAIPQPRVTTEMNAGRQTRARTVLERGEGSQASGRGRGRKRQRNPDAGRGRGATAASGRGRGAAAASGRGRGGNATAGGGRWSNIAAGGGRGATHVAGRGTGGRGGMPGDRAYWLLFGEERRVEIPDLNDPPEEFLAPDP